MTSTSTSTRVKRPRGRPASEPRALPALDTPRLRGISYQKPSNSYIVVMSMDGIAHYIGSAPTIERAFIMYVKATARATEMAGAKIRIKTIDNVLFNYTALYMWKRGPQWEKEIPYNVKMHLNHLRTTLNELRSIERARYQASLR